VTLSAASAYWALAALARRIKRGCGCASLLRPRRATIRAQSGGSARAIVHRK
jgi:hypothetical protein